MKGIPKAGQYVSHAYSAPKLGAAFSGAYSVLFSNKYNDTKSAT